MKSKFQQIIIPLLACMLAVLNGCDPPFGVTVRYGFQVKNNSSGNILYQVSENYPDTTIMDFDKGRVGDISMMGSQIIDSKYPWPAYFENLPADTLSIFFISQDTISKYGWKQIQSKYLILKRKDISLQDLEINNYLVTYP
jgi:hypothetical protein